MINIEQEKILLSPNVFFKYIHPDLLMAEDVEKTIITLYIINNFEIKLKLVPSLYTYAFKYCLN